MTNHKMSLAKNRSWIRNYSIQGLLDELDLIERFTYEEQRTHYREIIEKQQKVCESIWYIGICWQTVQDLEA